MYSGDVSIPLHVAPVRLSVMAMMAAVDRMLVGVEAVRWMESNPAAPLLLVHLLGEAVNKRKLDFNKRPNFEVSYKN